MKGICCGDIVGGGCLLLSLFKQKVLTGWLSVSFILHVLLVPQSQDDVKHNFPGQVDQQTIRNNETTIIPTRIPSDQKKKTNQNTCRSNM